MHDLLRIAVGLWLLSAAACGNVPDPMELFNGRDLAGWTIEGPREYRDGERVKPLWSVQNGLLVCDGKEYGFLRFSEQEFGDFVLHVEYRMAPRANSGIGIRTIPYDPARSETTRPSHAAFEVQLMDDADQPQPDVHSSGALYNYIAPSVSNAVRSAPEWNAVDIECRGPRIKVTINGGKVLDCDTRRDDRLKDKPRRGYVALQSHTSPVEFRSIRIHELP